MAASFSNKDAFLLAAGVFRLSSNPILLPIIRLAVMGIFLATSGEEKAYPALISPPAHPRWGFMAQDKDSGVVFGCL
ncbi:MAG: hypothetical protein Q4B48_01025 [Syntrophomonadaceae bacterium]|nr:hypothetical protein [Syntrophomonadaceae bacterium]